MAEADVVSLHVDGRAENTHLIGAAQFQAMKPGTLFLNLSRGHVVDIGALAQAIGAGRIGGKEDSDDKMPPALLNSVFERIFAFERHAIGRVPFPPGVSLVAIISAGA